jgi:glutamate--cysteine ligase catalytic subunit
MEVQLTDFENAAWTVFSVLVTRVVLAFDLALYIPLSKVDENMRRATLVDASRKQKFYFRKNLAASVPAAYDTGEPGPQVANDQAESNGHAGSNGTLIKPNPTTTAMLKSISGCNLSTLNGATPTPTPSECGLAGDVPNVDDMYEEMTMDEIFNGKCCYFPGLIPLVYAYLEYINADSETYNRIDLYLRYIAKRAKGETVTPAAYFRKFIISHPSYKYVLRL